MKKKRFWHAFINLQRPFLFGTYGKDVCIEPGVVINRPGLFIWEITFGLNGIPASTFIPKTRSLEKGFYFWGTM